MRVMNEEIKQKWETGNYVMIPTWERALRFVSLLGVVILIFYIGAWTKNSEISASNHTDDTNVHMPLREKQKEFITRREYQITLKNIEKSLDDINKKINK